MNNIISILKSRYSNFEETDSDENIISSCINGNYTEEDFFYACKKLFETTKENSLKKFRNIDIFIKYRNMHKERYPEWINNLSPDDQYYIKDNYKAIVGHCFREWNSYDYNRHADILELIQSYHKEGIPYWIITENIKINIDTYKRQISKSKKLNLK